ncbi:helix-turn-helix transcriptional regulator [uncultured Oscillibacter sp.]|uniref:helix-turn-helix domain-containing protein n=1 Tax=Dysosmobacter sp. TaxID=2591382 RepID=UPI002613E188|nr:helix-turn-helix transcriptional regulator [uncultured Oscillibacter sp.]
MKTEFPDRYRRLGIKIAYYRKLAGLTQAELAERIDKSTAFLGQVEAPGIVCGVSLETLFKIAREVGVSPAKLLEEDE